jgi:hypothetical protein
MVTLSSIMLVVASFYLVRMLTSGSSEWPLGVGVWMIIAFIAVHMWRSHTKKP